MIHTQASSSTRFRSPVLWLVVGGIALFFMLLLAGIDGGLAIINPQAALLRVLPAGLVFASLWLISALGYGWLSCALIRSNRSDSFWTSFGVGVAVLLTLDATLGTLGLLSHPIIAWSVVAVGIIATAIRCAKWMRAVGETRTGAAHVNTFAMLTVPFVALPAIAVILTAACSAPGWLWASEFGGYDALSYHLQLPREWLQLGRITPLEHNVYSFLPGYAEAAYMHLMVLRGNAIEAAYIAQMLHAALAILSSLSLAALLRRWHLRHDGSAIVPAAGAALFIGLPWVIVVGSLAYNELFVVFLLISGLHVIAGNRADGDHDEHTPRFTSRDAVMLGLIIGAACGAKLTAIGFAALPLMFAGIAELVATHTHRSKTVAAMFVRMIAVVAITAFIALLPWLIRNHVASGNPVFPFAAGIFGEGHWTSSQHANFARGHSSGASLSSRLAAVWNELMRQGIGPSPLPAHEPWKPQWSIFFWLVIASTPFAVASRAMRSRAMMLVLMLLAQLMFWLFATHLKSRFMLPAIVPGVAMIGLAVSFISSKLASTRSQCVLNLSVMALLIAWCIQPFLLWRSERAGAPSAHLGTVSIWTGDALSRAEVRAVADAVPSVFLNTQLSHDARVLLIGDATPFYITCDVAYATVWDTHPLVTALAETASEKDALTHLRAAGYTHVFVNTTMLEVWQRSGWLDPSLKADRIIPLLDRETTQLRVFAGDGSLRLYALE
ncbi:MAG: hypothetical protein ACR2GY_03740 [Phycisphaerales bacterium]